MNSVRDYHERSKHRLERYAPGPGTLDWANQPDPFRTFKGAPRFRLPHAADTLGTRYNEVREGDLPPPAAITLETVATFLELSFGLSAWKTYGANRWALRCNPSSGNLHPTEAYLLCAPMEGLPGGLCHYLSREHALERRAIVPAPAGGFLLGLTSIHWREAWKYGMRAWRYCQHDCGHAIAAAAYAAAALGWQARVVASASDAAVAALLGLDRDADFEGAEREAPDALLWIGDAGQMPDVRKLLDGRGEAVWKGKSNRLSAERVEWGDIDRIQEVTIKREGIELLSGDLPMPRGKIAPPRSDLRFAQIARQRRSAVDFDGVTRIDSAAFFAMLECLLPRTDTPPWNAWPEAPQVHPAFMVHRVEGLEAGLYILVREPAALEGLKASMRPDWLWRKVGPERLPLFLLLPHDLRVVARAICCHQDIAADSCFALGMLAHVGGAMREPWRYRRLYWECGMLGHVLYLEAEAAGVRGTGIGCFFDDEMHALLGLKDATWQSLYHFTVGGPLEDARLSTLPPYD